MPMNMRNKNLRDMDISTSTGKDVRDTQQLSGEAKGPSIHGGPNEATQYETAGIGSKGALGGKNTNS